MVPTITADELRHTLTYDPDTGLFAWRERRRGRRFDRIGTRTTFGHVQIKIDGVPYLAHRLAWLYMTGEWPERMIDHENRIPDDNRFSNLRLASNKENQQNRVRAPRTSISGIMGVRFRKNGWEASIMTDGTYRYLGRYRTSEEAQDARLRAKRELHPFCTTH